MPKRTNTIVINRGGLHKQNQSTLRCKVPRKSTTLFYKLNQGCWEQGAEAGSGSWSNNFKKIPGAGVFREPFFI
jgi:hypothetical protein